MGRVRPALRALTDGYHDLDMIRKYGTTCREVDPVVSDLNRRAPRSVNQPQG
jgi:hypothetical protein